MDTLWLKINNLLGIFFGTNFTLFERLLIIGIFFGVFVFLFRKLRGD